MTAELEIINASSEYRLQESDGRIVAFVPINSRVSNAEAKRLANLLTVAYNEYASNRRLMCLAFDVLQQNGLGRTTVAQEIEKVLCAQDLRRFAA